MRVSIKQIYDITAAFITDCNTNIQTDISEHHTEYKLTRNGYTLYILAPHGAPEWNISDEFWLDREGTISLYYNSRLVSIAFTKHNVGLAMDKSPYNPIRIATRMLSPRFFKLLDMAKSRFRNTIPKTDNSAKIRQLLCTLNAKQK